MSGTALRRLAMATGFWLATTAGAPAVGPGPWPDSFVGRLEALALIESLNADLLAHDSATLTLERWCADHRLADPARIIAERVHGVDQPATPDVRAALDVKSDEPLGYRRVRLKCGERVLSEADNWYVQSRLTPDMNHVLDTTDTPFGKAVAALHFRRHTLAAELLWRPLPQGWEMGAAAAEAEGEKGALAAPARVLEHRAVLSTPDGEPFSEVVETYTGEVLAFPPPR
jgi:chorismate-pyruvate lyase